MYITVFKKHSWHYKCTMIEYVLLLLCVYITGSDISSTGAGGQYREAQRGPRTGPGKEGRQHVPNAIQESKGVYKP